MASKDKFLMICYVAADFGPVEGMRFKITPDMRGNFIEAPAWIKDTLLYKWLLKDGSIVVADKQISKKQGENDPMVGISAEGKSISATEASEQDRNNATVEDLISSRAKDAPEEEAPAEAPAEESAEEAPAEEKPAEAAKPAKPAKAKAAKNKAVDEK